MPRYTETLDVPLEWRYFRQLDPRIQKIYLDNLSNRWNGNTALIADMFNVKIASVAKAARDTKANVRPRKKETRRRDRQYWEVSQFTRKFVIDDNCAYNYRFTPEFINKLLSKGASK